MKRLSQAELVRMPAQERLALISELWDSLADADVPLTPAQESELERRLASVEDDRRDEMTWEQLKAELQQWRS
jgi:putative addiction module component (TIGR02574 family)